MVAEILDPRHHVITIRGALTPQDCAALTAFAEGIGFSDAPITTAAGFVMAPEIRNNTRVMVDDPARAAELWQRLSPHIPAFLNGCRALGLNERFRFYRYDRGEKFAWHYDGPYSRPNGECSRLTLMLYLNDDFEGGATEFQLDEWLVVQPEAGMVLLFDHPVLHQGSPVTRGRKYVLRTDVMYEAPFGRSRWDRA